jgi:hypothetical protein
VELIACWLVLAVPLIAFYFAGWGAVLLDDRRRARLRRQGRCLGCGYEVAGLRGRCPECGAKIADAAGEHAGSNHRCG